MDKQFSEITIIMKKNIMNTDNNSEYFEAYLKSNLSEEERQVFETKLNENKDFKLQFEAHKAVIRHFRKIGKSELKVELKEIHREIERGRIISFHRRIAWASSIAAVFACVIILTIWQPTKIPNKKIFELYATVSPDTIFSNLMKNSRDRNELIRELELRENTLRENENIEIEQNKNKLREIEQNEIEIINNIERGGIDSITENKLKEIELRKKALKDNELRKIELNKIELNKIEQRKNEIVRGNECVIENLSNEDCEKAKKALIFYNKEKYDSVIIELGTIKNLKEKNSVLLLYLAISQLKSGKDDKAIENFEYLSSLKEFSYREQMDYYFGLALLKKGELSEARNKFKSVVQKNGIFSSNAKVILKKMRWF